MKLYDLILNLLLINTKEKLAYSGASVGLRDNCYHYTLTKPFPLDKCSLIIISVLETNHMTNCLPQHLFPVGSWQ